MSAKLTGARSTIRRFRRLPSAMNDASTEVLHQWAEDVEGTAKDLAPVDTGTLKGNITHFVRESERFARVGTFDPEVYYAKFVENGTSDTPEQPFLRPAFRRHKRATLKMYRKAVRRLLG